MKNLVRKACVLASALVFFWGSSASTVYRGYLIPRNDIEYDEEEDFETGVGKSEYNYEHSSSDLGGIIALVVLSPIIFVGAESGKDCFFSANSRNSRDDDTQKTIHVRKQIFIREIIKQSEVTIVKNDTPKYQEIEHKSMEGKNFKCLHKFMVCGDGGFYIPVKFDKQPKEYNMSKCDYNFLIYASILGCNRPDKYHKFLNNDPEFPSVEEIEEAKNMMKDNYSAAPVVINQ